jgi:hypothetical protein
MQQAVSGMPDDLLGRTPDIEPGSVDPASGGDEIGVLVARVDWAASTDATLVASRPREQSIQRDEPLEGVAAAPLVDDGVNRSARIRQ